MTLPRSQQRHSNVSVVKYLRNGVHLEVACYKNKIVSYRNGVEVRLDEVLQIERIFTNVSRGAYASDKDIKACLGSDRGKSLDDAIRFILLHGEVQVAEQERIVERDDLLKDIVNIIVQKCVHCVTTRPFPPAVIEQALKQMGVVLHTDQSAKRQALALIQGLIQSGILPIRRAQMKLRLVTASSSVVEAVMVWLETHGMSADRREADATADGGVAPPNPALSPTQLSVALFVEPHLYRDLDQFVKVESEKAHTVAVLTVIETAVMTTGEGAVEELMTEALAAPTIVPKPTAMSSNQLSGASSAKNDNDTRSTSPSRHSAQHSAEPNQPSPAGGRKEKREKREKKPAAPKVSTADGDGKRIELHSGSEDESEGGKKKKGKGHSKKIRDPVQQPTDDRGESTDSDVVSDRKHQKKLINNTKPRINAVDDDEEAWKNGEIDLDGDEA